MRTASIEEGTSAVLMLRAGVAPNAPWHRLTLIRTGPRDRAPRTEIILQLLLLLHDS